MDQPLGSAKWSQSHGMSRRDALAGDVFFLGHPINVDLNQYDSGNLYAVGATGHLLTVAPTRAGKGVSLIVPNLLYYGGSAVVIDPKGENAWLTAARRAVLGQMVYIVDPWDEVNRRYGSKAGVKEKVARFNPLSVLKPGSDDFIDHLAYLADALIITQSSKEPYFDDTARELWAGLMAFVVEHPPYSPYASLALARELLMRPDDELSRTINTAVELGSGSVARLKLGQFKNPDASKGIASVVSTARTQTAFLDSDVLNRNMETSDFSFDDLRQGGRPSTVYLVLPPDKLDTYARWLRLMVSVAIGAVQKGPLEKGMSVEQITVREEPEEREPEPEPLPKSEPLQPQQDLVWTTKPGKSGLPEFSLEPAAKPLSFEEMTAKRSSTQGYPVLEPLTELPESLRLSSDAQDEIPESVRRLTLSGAPIDAVREKWLAEPARSREQARPLTDPKLKWFGIYADAESAVRAARERADRSPVLFLLDEFGTIGRLAAVAKAYGLMAGLGVVVWAFVQDLNQLQRHYPDEWQTFIGNVNALVCFGIMDQFTVDYVSKMLGTTTIRYKTTSTGSSENTKIVAQHPGFIDSFFYDVPFSAERPSGNSKSENTSEHVVAQPLCSPDEIRRMDSGKCIVIGRGDPVMCQRLTYFTDRHFGFWARPDPRYEKTSP